MPDRWTGLLRVDLPRALTVGAAGLLYENNAQKDQPEKEQKKTDHIAEDTGTREWTGVDDYGQSPNQRGEHNSCAEPCQPPRKGIVPEGDQGRSSGENAHGEPVQIVGEDRHLIESALVVSGSERMAIPVARAVFTIPLTNNTVTKMIPPAKETADSRPVPPSDWCRWLRTEPSNQMRKTIDSPYRYAWVRSGRLLATKNPTTS